MVYSVSSPIEAAPPGPRVCPRFLPSTSRAPRSLLFHTDFTELKVTIKPVPTASTCSRGALWFWCKMGGLDPLPQTHPGNFHPRGLIDEASLDCCSRWSSPRSSCGCAVSERSPLKGKPPPPLMSDSQRRRFQAAAPALRTRRRRALFLHLPTSTGVAHP